MIGRLHLNMMMVRVLVLCILAVSLAAEEVNQPA